MNKILHITPHLGGGVGQVLLNWLSYDNENLHLIATLDYANEKALLSELNIFADMHQQKDKLLKRIETSDITIVHFWNHPLLWDFLTNTQLPPCRLIFWAHTSGFEPPNVFTDTILNYPDKFIFTSPFSFNTEIAQKFGNKKKSGAILSTGGIEHVKDIAPIPHASFNIGYIGTVDYAKMHPKYIETHKQIKDSNFIIVGGDNHKNISKEADERFNFVGKVSDVRPYLTQMDVFGYLLNEKHYGTAEQVLQEAMAAGVVPVVLNNPAESTLVKHNETGLVAKSLTEYIEYISLLQKDIALRKNLSRNAKAYAQERFSLKNLKHEWDQTFMELMQSPRTTKHYPGGGNLSAFEVFLESLGEHCTLFKNENNIKQMLKLPEWSSNTKGTPRHYLEFFRDDADLQRICSLY